MYRQAQVAIVTLLIPIFSFSAKPFVLTGAAAETALNELTLGFYSMPISDDVGIANLEDFKWPIESGAVVSGVATKSPALEAGIGRFDIIVRLNGKEIHNPDDIAPALAGHPIKKRVVVNVIRPEYIQTGGTEKVKWKRKVLRIPPTTLKQYFSDNLKAENNAVNDTISWEPFDASGIVNDHTGIVARVITAKEKKPILHLVIKYVADDWLFFDAVHVKSAMGKSLLKNLDVERDNSGGRIWEWAVVGASASNDAQKAVDALKLASNAQLTYVGKQYQKELSMPTEDLVNVRLMVHFYEVMTDLDEKR